MCWQTVGYGCVEHADWLATGSGDVQGGVGSQKKDGQEAAYGRYGAEREPVS